MANVVNYDAAQHSVDSVTVFQADRAEVKRKLIVNLKDGQNDVEVKNLPTCLDEGSIRVDGIGNAVIFDMVYHSPPTVNASKESDANINSLKKRKKQLETQLAIFTRQASVLKEYSKTLAGKDTNADELDNFLDVYAARQTKIDTKVSELEDEIASIDEELTKSLQLVGKDLDSLRLRGVRLTVVVLASGDGEAEISITYVVSNARWLPQYDLRAAIASDTKSKSTVELHYRASISQHTGEDWNSVALTLSTASPLTGTNIPKLDPYWIGERQKFFKSVASKSLRMKRGAPVAGAILRESAMLGGSGGAESFTVRNASVEDGFGALPPPPPGFFRAQDSEATEGAVSTTFGISGLSTIPSDAGDSSAQQEHKVSIAQLDFDSVELEWITVPKDVPSAYLQCKVQNTSKYVFLPGPANVFMNNNFVAKSRIPHVSPQENFSCSLGVDPAVRVTYHPQSKKIRTAGGNLLTAKTTTTAFEQGISIKNTRLTTVHRLLVKEQVPVSHDARIKVSLTEPRTLANASKLSATSAGVAVSEGVRARWLPRNEENNMSSKAISAAAAANEDLDAESARGLLEWVCEIKPSSSIDLALAWEVNAPAGLDWARQI